MQETPRLPVPWSVTRTTPQPRAAAPAKDESEGHATDHGPHLRGHHPRGPATRSGTASSPAPSGRQGLRRHVEYSSDPDPAKQSQLIDAAVADEVDGIVVSMANPDGAGGERRGGRRGGHPGHHDQLRLSTSRQDFGAITHIGQSETIAGEAAGEQLKEAGLTNVDLRDPGGRQRRPGGAVQRGRREPRRQGDEPPGRRHRRQRRAARRSRPSCRPTSRSTAC